MTQTLDLNKIGLMQLSTIESREIGGGFSIVDWAIGEAIDIGIKWVVNTGIPAYNATLTSLGTYGQNAAMMYN